jgi:LPS sulfotransferase NodH
MEYFTVITEGRAGSSLLISSLNSHPEILCFPEVLADLSDEWQDRVLDAIVKGKSFSNLSRLAEDRRYFHRSPGDRSGALQIGFKVKLSQVGRLRKFATYLDERNYSLIYLTRKNIVRAAISEIRAEALRKAHGVSNASRASQVIGRIRIDPSALMEEVISRLHREEIHTAFFDAYPGRKERFDYSELQTDPSNVFGLVLRFLGVSQRELVGKFHKNTPQDLEAAIENFEEIRDLLSGTSYADLLKAV